ncbi:transcription factor tfiiic complex subunit sfc4 [Histoplasma capsulatum]|uniref:Transcription factor tfiiic complex subunit sfc4 n=1 Tax=Ajellomyces capsulatus TaxID=5037 RepID=A0A8A1M6A4_AJECA|nr:transcription factor tfiiic complex subunit sfc4 [Histoplasma capsulatum]
MSENEDVDMDSGSESELSASDTSCRKEGYDDYYNRNRRQTYSSELETSMDNPDLHISEGGSSESESLEEPDQFSEDVDPDLGLYGRRARRGRQSIGRPYNFGARGGKGIKRGPRKPLEPSLEFKNLHSEATSAFIDADYERATVLVKQAIQINPEMFAAHSLLSEIFLAQGQKDKALAALFSGAHTRPKDPSVWMKVAKLILERTGEDRTSALQDVIYCYSRVIEIDQKNYDIRFERASVYRELGHNGKAAQEYERLLKDLPHNTTALRLLAETYIDLNEVDKAKSRYDESIAYYMSLTLEEATDFTWSDVNIYVEFFSYLDDHEQGIFMLKSLSRWLLGRKDNVEWDDIVEDDREFDAEHFPRRSEVAFFVPNKYPIESYGSGLPLELRVKLGIYRLKLGLQYREEALSHFSWLNPDDSSEGALLYDFGDLFREAGDALKDAQLHQDAILFYLPLQRTHEYADTSLFMSMAECYVACENDEAAENCYLTVVEYDRNNIVARAKLAKFYEKLGMIEQALKYVNEAIELGRQESMPRRRRKFGSRALQLAREFRSTESGGNSLAIYEGPIGAEIENWRTTTPPASVPGGLVTSAAPLSKKRRQAKEEYVGADHIRYLYSKLLDLEQAMREGQEDVTEDWLDIADALLRDFRSNRVFFPMQRNMIFSGYSREAQRKAGRLKSTTIMDEMEEMAGRLQATLGKRTPEIDPATIPNDYHSISFEQWLDIFLEYALVLSGQGQSEEAYDTLSAAADASIWYHSKPSKVQIYTCWFTCALRLKDEETLSNISRWFMKEYQFVTDTYRLFATLSRLCGDPRKSLFHSSPSMKFMLRQIKAIDYTLPDDPLRPTQTRRTRASVFQERATLTTKDASGQPIPAEDMDIPLLVLYGHILYAGTSFTNALNYFFRAYALAPENPVVLLSIGLSYIHHSLKRQSDNRHYLIMQGLSFMQEYRRVREKSPIPQERQEVEFNFARVWQMLGLTHLAVLGYHRCLALSEEVEAERERFKKGKKIPVTAGGGAPSKDVWVEDFTREAAFALQCLYSFSEETKLAKEVTDRWLVI